MLNYKNVDGLQKMLVKNWSILPESLIIIKVNNSCHYKFQGEEKMDFHKILI